MIFRWLKGYFQSEFDERLPLTRATCSSAVCASSGAREISRGELAVRGHHRNLYPFAANGGRLAQRWDAGVSDSQSHANALLNVTGSNAPGPLFTTRGGAH